jgi:hypothetical protein
MDLLPLDDPRWRELDHRNWRDGTPSEWATDAPFVPDELAELVKNPWDLARFRNLWPWLSSEGMTYSAAYAAVPYMVSFAEQLPPEQRLEYLCVVGIVEASTNSKSGESFAIKDYLQPGYHRALSKALAMIGEMLGLTHDASDTRYLLAAAAALKGHRRLAMVLQDMDCICGDCPKCGESVYPVELQKALR